MSGRRGPERIAQALLVAFAMNGAAQAGSLGPVDSLDANAVPGQGEPSMACSVCTRRHNARLKRRSDKGQCRIKGEIGAAGERIYHLPGGSRYELTDIDPAQGERWFCTEADAQAAGWKVGEE